ncbi:hypothetical protein LINPERHAP1_LOCUS10185 [Linum perenne]
MNMIRFVTPSENLFDQLQFMDIAVKLAGIPIDCRTLAFGRQMLEKIGEVRKVNFFIADTAEGFFIKGLVKLDLLGSRAGRITARFPDGRSFFVYFQYIQIQAICYQCGIIGHIYDFCPHQHLILDLEARNKWMCIPDCGKLVEGPNLQKKATNKYQSRRGAPCLPPSVMASFAAARSNPPSPGQGQVLSQGTKKGGQPSSSAIDRTTELVNGSEVGTKVAIETQNSTCLKANEEAAGDDVETGKSLKRKKMSEEKGKTKAEELEKEPKKALIGNKGIVITNLDDGASGERGIISQQDQIAGLLKNTDSLELLSKGTKKQDNGPSDLKNTKSSFVNDLFGIPRFETCKKWFDQEINDEDGIPWTNKIDTYGSNEDTIGEMLRKEDAFDKED